ncbi:MAG: Gfo/Idh/MocA family oxidoreductase [Planctomycetota bacterium]
MAKKKCLRMGVIGTGSMGMGHCETIRARVPEMRLAAVCDGVPAMAERAGTAFGVPHFTSYRDLIRAKLVDAVVVPTPHPTHAEISIACMKAGLHVMCEKPLSETVSSADRMIATARKHRVAFAVMFQRRFDPAIDKAMELVRTGKLGAIYRTLLICPEFRTQAYYDSGSWRATWSGEGGGVMMNQGPHIIDIFVQLTGLPVKVRGRLETRFHTIEVEDLAEATLTYKNGATGYFYCSTNEPPPGETIEIFAEKGKLTLRDGALEVYTYTPGVLRYARTTKEKWGKPKTEKMDLRLPAAHTDHYNALRNFARHILYREKLRVSGESGLASLELTNAVMLSSWLGREVTIPISRRAYDRELARLRKSSKFKKTVVENWQTDPQHLKQLAKK